MPHGENTIFMAVHLFLQNTDEIVVCFHRNIRIRLPSHFWFQYPKLSNTITLAYIDFIHLVCKIHVYLD